MRSRKLFSLVVLLFMTGCTSPLRPTDSRVPDTWQVYKQPDLGISLFLPPSFQVITMEGENSIKLVDWDAPSENVIILRTQPKSYAEEMAMSASSELYVDSDVQVIDGGNVTINKYINEGPSRYRDYIFRRDGSDAVVFVAEMTGRIPDGRDGTPDNNQATITERILKTVRLNISAFHQ